MQQTDENFLHINNDYFKLGLSPSDVIMLAYLKQYSHNNICQLTNKMLSSMMNISERTVDRAINALESFGYINKETKSICGNGRSNRIRNITINDDIIYNVSHNSSTNDTGKYSVYIHNNKINNKSYVGITCLDVNQRWQNGMGYKDNDMFFEDILKYGWDNFNHTILHTGLAKKEALEFESLYIDKFNTTDKNFGYNRKS